MYTVKLANKKIIQFNRNGPRRVVHRKRGCEGKTSGDEMFLRLTGNGDHLGCSDLNKPRRHSRQCPWGSNDSA